MSRWLTILPVSFILCADPLMADEEPNWDQLMARKKEFSAMQPSKAEGEEFEQFLKDFSTRAGELAEAFKAYYERNPESKEGREAWRQWMNHLDLAAHRFPQRRIELEEAEKNLLADAKLRKEFREQIRWNQVDRIRDLAEMERFVRSVKDEFTGSSFLSHHLLNIASFSDADHARKLVDEVLKLPRPNHEREYWEGEAMKLKSKLDRIGKPVELKFTALDGAKIDLGDYAGKVVLIDFWATWCGPCIAGIPKLRKIWETHRNEGFEIVGISYDQDRKALEKFVQKNSIPWPQFYSESGNEAPLVVEFGKPGPPAYWLVDRNGILADISGLNDMEKKVKRLLAEKIKTTERSK